MILDRVSICNRLPDVRIWGDGRTILSRYNGQGREVLEGHLSPQQIQSLLQNLQELGFTGAYTPEEVVPAPVSYYLNVYLKSGKVTRQWNYRSPLVNRFLLRLPFSEFSHYQPQKALLYVGSLGSGGGPSGDSFPEWPSNIGLSLASVPVEGVWVEGDVLRFLWNSVNSQSQTPPGFKSAGQYYEVGVEIPGISMMDVPYKCW